MTTSMNLSGRLLAGALAILPITAACATMAPQSAYAQQAEAQNIVVHIGQFTNDLHSTFMGLSLATNLQGHGAQVTVFLDREAVRLVDASERGDLVWGDTESIEAALAAFVEAGGSVLVCPHCASLGGVEADDLRPGARIATQDEVAELFIAADKVVDF